MVLPTGFFCSIIIDATFIQSSGMLEAQVKEGIEWKKEWGRVGGLYVFHKACHENRIVGVEE